MKKKRLSRNIAKVEFIANEETIKNMIAEGYPLKVVHEILSQEKGIKMAYTTFAFHYRKAKERLQKISEDIEHKNNHTKQENKNKTSSPPIIGESKVKDPCNPDSYLESKLIKPKE